ncbi:hypothetical protein QVD17_25654 [Tagetes erecta]|uniref:Uncharacterized protein n=1 Tax=Tagetes erecta TaxID=13708 RepID=A0AAD8KJB0_TARER|nr:hypothetical protein QVD17_25654 [Tagetes erecta]
MEKERNELRDLVGKNLHVLSQIKGIDLDLYKETVLPKVLEQVVNCKDELAQYYLMDCLIQPTVDIKTVLSQLMERLSSYAASSPEVLPEFLQVEAFAKLTSAIGKVNSTHLLIKWLNLGGVYRRCGHMDCIIKKVSSNANGLLRLKVTCQLLEPLLCMSLLTFTLCVHPDRLDYVDQVLVIETQGDMPIVGAITLYVSLLTFTLRVHPDRLAYVDQVLVEVLFKLSKGLIKDLEGDSEDEFDEEDFNEEQIAVARVIHVLYNDDPEEMLKIICTVRKHIMAGGPKRLPFTVPPLVFSALKLIRRLQNHDGDVAGEEDPATPKKFFQLLNQIW